VKSLKYVKKKYGLIKQDPFLASSPYLASQNNRNLRGLT